MLLELVSAAVGSTETVNAAPVEITDLAYDTRSVTQGSLFFCVRGGRIDGHDLAADAIAAGATALVVERPLPLPVPQVVVASARAAMPRAAVAFFNDPTALLKVVAVTGTNGKTTSAYLLDGRATPHRAEGIKQRHPAPGMVAHIPRRHDRHPRLPGPPSKLLQALLVIPRAGHLGQAGEPIAKQLAPLKHRR